MSSRLASLLKKDDLPSHIQALKFQEARAQKNALLKHLIVVEKRIDLLAEHVLGYPPADVHYTMMGFQRDNQEGLILAWRGAAKSSYCTITYSLFSMIQDPNIRILLTSNAVDQSRTFLKSIKSHLEHNETFRELFGDWVTGARTWAETDITINQRKSHAGEPTVLCTGMGTALPSRHFDLIIADDLVIKDNSQTDVQRKKIHDYFYETLYPTLESPHGRLFVIGTRWHEQDFYGWLSKNDYAKATLILGVLDDETDLSRWPSKYPTERMHKIRQANPSAFELQYQCKTGLGLGGVFTPAHFVFDDDPYPENLNLWQGVDLAIGQREHNDLFVNSTVGINPKTRDPYLISVKTGKFTFPQQVAFVAAQYHKHPSTIRVVVETNAYQIALKQQLEEDHPDIPVQGRYTLKDKMTRAQKLAFYLTDHPLHVRRQQGEVVRLLQGFPHLKGSKDVFDSLDLAIGQGLIGARRKTRTTEPGLI